MSTYGATEKNTPVNLTGADDQVTVRCPYPKNLLLDQIMGPIPFQSGETKQSLNEMSPLTRLFD